MTPRKEKILSSVVTGYVSTGEPVGSKGIADAIGVSSATVRNEMAELIELGLLEQPHTSAGRIPSQKGYREYVDHLMQLPGLSEEEERYLDAALLGSAYDPERFLAGVSELLASVTKYAAIATTPSGRTAQIRAVQFVQTSRRTAMLLLMSSAGTMKSKVFRCDFNLTGEIMRVFFRIFNEKLTGKNVADITPAFLQTMGISMGQLSALAGAPLSALFQAAQDTMETQPLISGQMNLLFYPELELGGVRKIMDFLEARQELSELFHQRPGKVTVLIGQENRHPELDRVSTVISRYKIGEQDAGALAIMGPVRMDYPKIIAVLQYLTLRVNKMLTMLMKEE